MKRCWRGVFTLFLLAVFCLNSQASALADSKIAEDLTSLCSFRVSSHADNKGLLCDGKHGTAWSAIDDADQFIEVKLPTNRAVAGIYIMWNCIPQEWSLEAMADGGDWQAIKLGGKSSYINTFIPLNTGLSKLRIMTDEWKSSIAEITAFGPGYLPGDVQVWSPSPEKADLMVISAHPDDEHIYFGGTLPYYAGQLKKHTVVVYMTSSPIIRKFEALDGLWKVGVREYPVFLPLANKYSSTVEEAELAWDGIDNTVKLLVEQIRQYKPDVIVTHDLGGEYGHGAHKLTALAVTKALEACNDKDEYTDSAEEFGVWEVKKCYLHLYPKNKLKMDWRAPLLAFDGKTALEMAQAGYDQHVSQHFRERPILDSGAYDNSKFGLYQSAVGSDHARNDFFENVPDLPISTPIAPVATAAPTQAIIVLSEQTPEPTGEPVTAVAAVPAGMRITADSELAIRVFLSFGAIAFLTFVLLAYRRNDGIRKVRHAPGIARSTNEKPDSETKHSC